MRRIGPERGCLAVVAKRGLVCGVRPAGGPKCGGCSVRAFQEDGTASVTRIRIQAANKYSARKTEHNGRTFDSAAEARRAKELELLQAAGVIRDLRYQVPFDLHACADANPEGETRSWYPVKVGRYVADFVFVDIATGKTVTEDVKGVRTAGYLAKRRHMKAEYGIDIQEVQA